MRALQFIESDIIKFSPAYLAKGDDECLKGYVKDALLSNISKNDNIFSNVNVNINDSKSVNDIIYAADTYSFPMSMKLIEVEEINFKLTNQDEKELEKYFLDPNPYSCILFQESSKNINFLVNHCEIIDCDKASENELFVYLTNKISKRGLFIKPILAREFIRECNFSFGKVNTEIEKIMLYCLDKKEITKDDIDLLMTPDLEVKTYELSNALTNDNFNKAIEILNNLKDRGYKSSELFDMLCSTYRRQYQIATTKASEDVIARTLNLKPAAVLVNQRIIDANKKKNKRYISMLKDVVEYLLDLERKYKSFIISDVDALDLAISHIIGQKEPTR